MQPPGAVCADEFSRLVQTLSHIRRNFMRKLVGLALVAGALLISACNTVEGVGKDVSSAGDTVAKTADSAK